jgi:hypothetical protein
VATRTGPRTALAEMVSQEQQLNGTVHEQLFTMTIQLQGKPVTAMIDSGASGNFITQDTVERNQLPTQRKNQAYRLRVVDGTTTQGTVDTETQLITTAVMTHREVIRFDVLEHANYPVILGKPWLRLHNPTINWRTHTIQFTDCSCGIDTPSRMSSKTPVTPPSGGRDRDSQRKITKNRHERVIQANHSLDCASHDTNQEKTSTSSNSGRGGYDTSGIKKSRIEGSPRNNEHPATTGNRPKDPLNPAIQDTESDAISGDQEPSIQNIQASSGNTSEVPQGKVPDEYKEFETLFQEKPPETALPEHQEWDHEIPIEPGRKPKFGPIYQLSAKELQTLREYLDENLKRGFIRPSKSPAGHPILFVPKKDGTLRLCVDYRTLNNITVKNRYALPLISELQDRFQGAKFFTSLDIREGYHKVRMKEGEEWKTAFRTRYGHYEYLVMPFGLTNAPATFQALINDTLREYLDDFVVAYLDDILIYTRTNLQDHIKQVKKVMHKLQEKGLQIKLSKCEFHQTEVNFLGSIISKKGIKMDPKKVKSIQDWPTPRSVKEVQSFLGLANFYRRFIKGFSGIARPLTDLTKKESTFTWINEHAAAFEDLKTRFTTPPILQYFDPEKEITLETDASDKAIGATISQPDDQGKRRPIAFHSRKLTGPELNYDIHDKELLAIVDAFQEWRVYLEGSKFPVTVITDHKNLVTFTTTKKLNRRQVRWAETLASHNFKIHYRKGTENTVADALSRRPDYTQKTPEETREAILRRHPEGHLEYNKTQEINTTFTQETDSRIQLIQEAYEQDSMAQTILSNQRPRNDQDDNISIQDGLILWRGLVYIPVRLRERISQEIHEEPTSGHQGIERTIERITRNYYFPGLRKTVEKIIQECDICKRSKHERHASYGKMTHIQTPDKPWKSISFDWITKLPRSHEPMSRTEYDSIWVITDRLTKYAYFLPYRESSTAEELGYMYLRHVISNHGHPETIITDRATIVTSKFWQTLMNNLGTKHKMTTAYHPQTNGQTERMNQVIEQYLRCYLNYQQDNWTELLPLAQYAYNSSKNSVTGYSPFFANYGYEPQIRKEIQSESWSQKARVKAENLQKLHKQLSNDIDFICQKTQEYYNQRRKDAPHFKEGDSVYILRRNIKTKRPSDKLDHTKIGPFRISQKLSDTNYRIQLPAKVRIHPVFHISLLEPAPSNIRLQQHVETEETEPEYEVEKILDTKQIRNQRYYLVKWKGYDNSENTWEPTNHLQNCQKAIQEFHQNRQPTSQSRK